MGVKATGEAEDAVLAGRCDELEVKVAVVGAGTAPAAAADPVAVPQEVAARAATRAKVKPPTVRPAAAALGRWRGRRKEFMRTTVRSSSFADYG